MTSELYEKIVSQRGTLENLVAKIPGFKGYHEKNARRQADTMLRDFLAERMDKIITHFVRAENSILGNGQGLMHMSRTREVKNKLESYRDRIKTANPKYSNMFASIKIGNEELDKIYAFDEAQLRFIDELEAGVNDLIDAVEKGEFKDALETVFDSAQIAIDAFMLRDDVILELADGGK
jgi:hypothetical protein